MAFDPSDGGVNTVNEYNLVAGENLPNHSASLAGRGNFVRQSISEIPTFRTRQQAYRYAAHLIILAEIHLPSEEGCDEHTFDMVLDAVARP